MKRTLKIIGKVLLYTVAALVIILLLCRFVFREQLISGIYRLQNKENLELLKKDSAYLRDTVSYHFQTIVQAETKQSIIEYFQLDTIPATNTWDKTVAIAGIVSRISHSNPDPWPEKKNAIDLWEWSKSNPGGFNCRMHSILLNELLISVGINSRVLCCLPADRNDNDSHVVNSVWLPEEQRWVMIDTDQKEYATDEHGTVLSLQQMRERIINGKPVIFNSLPGYSVNENELTNYWSKNLYWFMSIENYRYDVETNDNPGTFVCLVPANNPVIAPSEDRILTTDEDRFWAEPSSIIVE